MLEDEYKDTYYEARRRQLVTIVVNCLNPDEYCFCLTMGTGPIAKNGYDLALTKISDDKYIVQAKSNIGLDIVKHLGLNLLQDFILSILLLLSIYDLTSALNVALVYPRNRLMEISVAEGALTTPLFDSLILIVLFSSLALQCPPFQ